MMPHFQPVFVALLAGIFIPAGTLFSASTTSATQKQREEALSQQARDAVIANVNGRIITINDIRQEVYRYLPEIRRSSKTEQEYQQKVNELVAGTTQNLSDSYLLASAFDDFGAIISDDYVAEQINARIDQDFDGDRAKYLQTLRLRGSNPLDDRRRMLDYIKATSWDEKMVKPAFGTISPAQVRAEYDANIEQYRSEAAVEYAQIILFAGASETDAEVEKLAERLLSRLHSGETDFESAAKIFSRDDYRSGGGYVGWRALSDLSEQIVPVLEKIGDGELSGVISLEAPTGKIFVILKRIHFREAGITPLKDVYLQIESRLRNERIRQLRAEKMAELRDEYYIHRY